MAGLALAIGCGGPGDDGSAPRTPRQAMLQAACRGGDERTMELAVGEYIKRTKPKPTRFLHAVGTDSALPESGVRALQDKGPTYLFPGDPKLQAQVRTQLHDRGDYTTMLIVPRGSEVGERTATVRLGGHYIGGEEEGQTAAPQTFTFSCDTTGWRLSNAAAEQRT